VGSHVGSANDLEVAVSSLGAVTQICFRARAATPGQRSDLSRGPAFEELFDRQRHREISIAQRALRWHLRRQRLGQLFATSSEPEPEENLEGGQTAEVSTPTPLVVDDREKPEIRGR
jgi:hypothetical protein